LVIYKNTHTHKSPRAVPGINFNLRKGRRKMHGEDLNTVYYPPDFIDVNKFRKMYHSRADYNCVQNFDRKAYNEDVTTSKTYFGHCH